MKFLLKSFMAITLLFSFNMEAKASVQVGAEAPNFTLQDSTGKEVSLSDYKGKLVVLEWSNYECPFVVKHYGSGNMQKLQQTYTDEGVVWLTIMSSAEGKQGYYAGEELAEQNKENGSNSTFVLSDASGEVGKAYGAKTTPHMYIVDKKGNIAYMGAIDNKPTTNKDDIKGAKNYIISALDSLLQGSEVKTAVTTPYGCSVKYDDTRGYNK